VCVCILHQVCDDGFDDVDAAVACRQLGFPGGVELSNHATVDGPSSTPILADDISCTGSEIRLQDCSGRWGSHNCGHHEDVGVTCSGTPTPFPSPFPTPYPLLPVRLRDGVAWSEGRLEIYWQGFWGTVCGNGFSDVDAVVVCRQLEISEGGVAMHSNHIANGNSFSSRISAENVSCSGTETHLSDCVERFRIWPPAPNCLHGTDIGVACLSARVELIIEYFGNSTIRLASPSGKEIFLQDVAATVRTLTGNSTVVNASINTASLDIFSVNVTMTFDSNYLAVSNIETLRAAEPSVFNVRNNTVVGTKIIYIPTPPPQSDEKKEDRKSDVWGTLVIPIVIACCATFLIAGTCIFMRCKRRSKASPQIVVNDMKLQGINERTHNPEVKAGEQENNNAFKDRKENKNNGLREIITAAKINYGAPHNDLIMNKEQITASSENNPGQIYYNDSATVAMPIPTAPVMYVPSPGENEMFSDEFINPE